MGLLIYLKESTDTPSWIFLSLVSGTGCGILFSAQGFAAQASVSNNDLPFAGAMYSFFRAFGQTIGVAISGVIFQNIFKQKLKATVYATHAAEWSRDASAFVQVVNMWSDAGDEGVMKTAVIKTYIESLRFVWITMCVLAAVAFMASVVWTQELSLERELETEQGFIHDRKSKSAHVDEEQPEDSSE